MSVVVSEVLLYNQINLGGLAQTSSRDVWRTYIMSQVAPSGPNRSHVITPPYAPVDELLRRQLQRMDSLLVRERPMLSEVYGVGVNLQMAGSLRPAGLEWVVSTIREHRLPIRIESANFGFDAFMVYVFDHAYTNLDPARRQLNLLTRFGSKHIGVPVVAGEGSEQKLERQYQLLLGLLQVDDEYRECLSFYGFDPLPPNANRWTY